MEPFSFFVAMLAAWRLTHLLSKEDGPFDSVFWLRKMAGAGFFGSLLDCPYCLSIWIAIPFAIYLAHGWREGLLLWLSLSGGVCLLEKLTTHSDR
jgi:hypothetical protein